MYPFLWNRLYYSLKVVNNNNNLKTNNNKKKGNEKKNVLLKDRIWILFCCHTHSYSHSHSDYDCDCDKNSERIPTFFAIIEMERNSFDK